MSRFPCLVVPLSARLSVTLTVALGVAVGSAACGSPTDTPIVFGLPDASAADAARDASSPLSDVGSPPPEAAIGCLPVDVSSFMPAYEKPTGPYAGACSLQQLDGLIAACFGKGQSTKACTLWLASANNVDCLGCWAGSAKAATWAPVIYSSNGGQDLFVNVGGCIALADPGAISCAQATEYNLECDIAACVPYCPIPTSGDTTDATNALNDCFNTADMGVCSMYAAQAASCAMTLSEDAGANGPAAFCYDAYNQPDALERYLALACGPGQDSGVRPPTGDGG